jgi:hypothetical protein
VTATTQSNTNQVPLQWSAVRLRIVVPRRVPTNVAGTFTAAGPATTSLSLTHTVAAGSGPVAYVYRVRSFDSAVNPSSIVSAMDYAVTGTTLFTNEPIQKQVTLIYGRHIGELRRAIDALSAAATTAQSPFPPVWPNAADPTGLITSGTITKLFTPLNQARQVFGYAPFAYGSGIPMPQQTGLILSEHVQQVRDALR